jgi:hypothetical protein
MGAVQLKADKACIDKELGCEIPEFIYEEAKRYANLKQALLIKMGHKYVQEPYYTIKLIAQYVRQIFDLDRYIKLLEG